MPMWLRSRRRSDAESDANSASSTVALGVSHSVREFTAAGRCGEALATIDTALLASPENADLISARGTTLFEWGRYHEARNWLAKAADLGACSTSVFLQLGWTLLWTVDAASSEHW